MSEWFETLEGLRDRAWDHLERAAAQSDAPMRLFSLATAGLGGGAEARMMVLRGADRTDWTLRAQTDRASRKVDELQATPLATLLFWHGADSLQIRARARVAVRTGRPVEAEWQAVPDAARHNYGGQPPPSTPMARAEEYEETAERQRFALLVAEISSLDILHLGDMHRRALFAPDRDPNWLAP